MPDCGAEGASRAVSSAQVIVIGGGPAGSSAAGFLAQTGVRVLLFERDHFPRYHVGESLLSATMPILDALGVSGAVERAGFVRKPGGTFVWGSRSEPWSFLFRDDPGGRAHAFHVVRSEFDEILLRHAAALGVDVREGHRVVEVARREGDRVAVVAIDASGRRIEEEADYAVDASGQRALLGRRDRLRQLNPFFRNLAVFAYFRSAERLAGALEGNILSAAFGDGWFWFIPLHDGTTSVGAVVDAQRFAAESAGDPAALYRRLIGDCAPVRERLRAAEMVSAVRVIRDYSYSSRRFHGPGYVLVGDAACFIDPVFSTGVHLACLSGYLAAEALGAILQGGAPAPSLERFESRYRAAYERYLHFLHFFYDHHSDPQSYFWRARKILNPEVPLDTRAAFVRLMSGGADVSEGDIADKLAARHARMQEAIEHGHFGKAPDAGLFRVRGTLATMNR